MIVLTVSFSWEALKTVNISAYSMLIFNLSKDIPASSIFLFQWQYSTALEWFSMSTYLFVLTCSPQEPAMVLIIQAGWIFPGPQGTLLHWWQKWARFKTKYFHVMNFSDYWQIDCLSRLTLEKAYKYFLTGPLWRALWISLMKGL